MSQILLSAGVNDFGGTLINESISTSAGADYGQTMKPKEIHHVVKSAGKIPAQRTSTYRILKELSEVADDLLYPLILLIRQHLAPIRNR